MFGNSDKELNDKQKQKTVILQSCFSSPEGKEALNLLMSEYGVATSHFHSEIYSSTGVTDPLKLAFLEGQRSVILDLIKVATLDRVTIEDTIYGLFDEGDTY